MLAIHDEAISSLRHHHLEGLVRIGAPHDVADTMLPPVLKEIALKFPGVQIDIHMERSPFLMESLKQGELDLVISNRDDTTFESFALRSSPLSGCAVRTMCTILASRCRWYWRAGPAFSPPGL